MTLSFLRILRLISLILSLSYWRRLHHQCQGCEGEFDAAGLKNKADVEERRSTGSSCSHEQPRPFIEAEPVCHIRQLSWHQWQAIYGQRGLRDIFGWCDFGQRMVIWLHDGDRWLRNLFKWICLSSAKIKKWCLMRQLFVFSMIFLFILGCAPGKVADGGVLPSRSDISAIDSCVSDSDCTCGGIDKLSGQMLLGDKDYYSKYVDTSKSCPDFCTGIAGNLVVKCVDNKCMQVLECLADTDCDKGGCVIIAVLSRESSRKAPSAALILSANVMAVQATCAGPLQLSRWWRLASSCQNTIAWRW